MAEPFKFHQIYPEEIEAINARRKRLKRKPVVLERAGKDREGNPVLKPNVKSDLVGLSLSGGGVRSASFCLGAMQALDEAGVIKKIDYLSTVSGGGCIGTSTIAAMHATRDDKFPFPSELEPEEQPGLRHVRDHSNYLFPRGKSDIFNNLAIYLRGLAANAILVLPFLLLFAALTIYSNPTVPDLTRTDFFGTPFLGLIRVSYFGITLHILLAILVLLCVWAYWRSFSGQYRDVGAAFTLLSAIALLGLLITAFFELQPVALDGLFNLSKNQTDLRAQVIQWFTRLSAVLAAFAAVVGFLAPLFGQLLKKGVEDPGWKARLGRILAKLAVYVAAAALPLVLWVAYLYLSYWGIYDPDYPGHYRAPEWLLALATKTFGAPGALKQLYFVVGIALLLGSMLLAPNANSLHRLYRDRLSKAFLFNPKKREEDFLEQIGSGIDASKGKLGVPQAKKTRSAANSDSGDLAPLDDLKLSGLDCDYVPYPIINTALNIRGSRYANQRGRNADFFALTPRFIGSKSTHYVRTEQMEKQVRDLDLAAAMAISGAAASSNMGSQTIGILSPTLAILNIRLGFWLPNPMWATTSKMASLFVWLFDQCYFLREMFGGLDEKSGLVYLTDGGHVENLGIYELLRRRCQVIIAVDAEADPDMSFNSFVALQRYALIDLGVLVALPWSKIRDATQKASKEIADTGGKTPADAAFGPHCAVGEIRYPDGGTGVLVYIKSSITGDENDYVVDYKRRYPAFPHEPTADQLFSEEQFEVYRALGFHATRRMLRGWDQVAVPTGPAIWRGRARRGIWDAARRALLARN